MNFIAFWSIFFYQCLTFTLLRFSITALSQRIVFKVAEEPPIAKWLQPAFISLVVFLMLSLRLHFFFNQTENLYLFFCNHRGHLIKIFNYVSLQFKSGASLGLL